MLGRRLLQIACLSGGLAIAACSGADGGSTGDNVGGSSGSGAASGSGATGGSSAGGSGGSAGAGGSAGQGGTAGDAAGGSGGTGASAGSSGAGGVGGDTGGTGGAGGSGGAAGAGGSSGMGGSGGSAGAGGGGTGGAGMGGSAGSGGSAGTGGSAGMGGAGSGGTAGSGGSAGTGGVPPVVDLMDVVARLTGEKPVNGTDRLQHRASVAERELTRVYLLELFTAIGLSGERHTYASGTNVYTELPATNGGTEYVLFGAHFDSVAAGPGANDNATGVALVLAVAEHVARLPTRSRSFYFVLFDEEELGLKGSAAFAEWLVGQNRTVHSVHTIDQMGWDNDGDRAIELELPTDELEAYYNEVSADGGFNILMQRTTVSSTDHSSFRERGFKAIGITEEYKNGDTTPHYHTAGDTYATVNFAYLASTTALMKYLMADLAK